MGIDSSIASRAEEPRRPDSRLTLSILGEENERCSRLLLTLADVTGLGPNQALLRNGAVNGSRGFAGHRPESLRRSILGNESAKKGGGYGRIVIAMTLEMVWMRRGARTLSRNVAKQR